MSNVRTLHPLSWWSWGLGLAIATSRTVNLGMLLIISGSAILVTLLRKTRDPWASALTIGIKVAMVALAFRMVIAIIFGVPSQGRVLFTIPRVQLPEWLAGILLGGPVTVERLRYVFVESLTIFSLVVAIAAASSLANPKQTLRSLPGVLHEAGVALIITTTLIPQFAVSVIRIRQARALRGDSTRFSFKKHLVPLFEEALERALILAESMEARGYGFRSENRKGAIQTGSILLGLFLLLLSLIQFLTGGKYLPLLVLSLISLLSGLMLANRQSARTRYRPLPWNIRDSVVLIATLAGIAIASLPASYIAALLLTLTCLSPLYFTRRWEALT